MKTLLVTLIKSAVWALILLASALMLLVIYSDKPWDPIGQIQHFNHQHRRDDALDLIRFLRATSTYLAISSAKIGMPGTQCESALRKR